MSCTRTVLSIVCFLAIACSVHAQPAAARPDYWPRMAAAYYQHVNDLVKKELASLRLVTELTDDQGATVLDNLDESIAAWTTEAIAKRADPFATPILMRAQQDAITIEVKKLLNPEAFQAYKADLALRHKFHRQTAQRAVLSTMDSLLQMTNKQQASVAGMLESCWNDDWNGVVQFAGQLGSVLHIQDVFKKLPQEELKATLSDSQWKLLVRMGDLSKTVAHDSPIGLAELEGKAIGELKIQELTELCKLSTGESEKLQEALDSSYAKTIERKKVVYKSLGEGQIEHGDAAAIKDLMLPVSHMLFTDEAWTKAIDGVLSKEQFDKYTTRQRSHEMRHVSTMASLMALGIQVEVGGVTGKQLIALKKLFEKHSAKLPYDPLQLATVSHAIPGKEFQEILKDKQWDTLSKMLDRARDDGEIPAAPE